jgi:hypothetical protein
MTRRNPALKYRMPEQGPEAMDFVVIGIGVLFFVLAFSYIKACENL